MTEAIHEVDSCIHAFAEATEEAVHQALGAAEPYLLEPWLKMSMEVPEEFVGALIGDLNSRRSRILTMDRAETPGRTLIAAEVPEVELKSYAAKSFEAWTGLFLAGPKRLNVSGVPAGYDRLPRSIADQMRYCASCERKMLPVVASTCPDCGHALGSDDDFTIV